MPLPVSVIIITYARPHHVSECLARISKLRSSPHEVIVVDASPDRRTLEIIEASYPEVLYLRNDLGPGTMPESRAIGLAVAEGDIVAFIDDDAYVDAFWLDELATPYEDASISAVGGRAVNGLPGEENKGLAQIGRFLPNGLLTGNFGADPGRIIEVDHLIGANMSFRRSALLSIGGIRGNYPGTCLCEESDISLRLKAAGHRLVFNPRAIVRHVAAPYTSGGQRFDRRYLYYARRNHVMLLARVFGFADPMVRKYLVTGLRDQRQYVAATVSRVRGLPEAHGTLLRPTLLRRLSFPLILTRSIAELAGLAAGLLAAISARRNDARNGQGSP